MWQSQYSRPNVGRGRSSSLKDFKELINIGTSWKEWHARGHFCKDTSNTPYIDTCRIAIGTQQ